MPFSVSRCWIEPSRHASNRSVQPPMCWPPMKICGIVGEPVRLASTARIRPPRSSAWYATESRSMLRYAMPSSREQLAHRPAELAPLEREQHHGLVAHELRRRAPPPRHRSARRAGDPAATARRARAHRSGRAASSARSRAPRSSSPRRCARTAASTDSARRCPAACRRCSCRVSSGARPSSAAASVAPLEVPTKMPSCRASSRARRNASSPATGTISSISPASTASSVSREMKSGAQPCIRCGRKRGWLPADGTARVARLRDAAAEHLRVVGLGRDDPRRRARLSAARARRP